MLSTECRQYRLCGIRPSGWRDVNCRGKRLRRFFVYVLFGRITARGKAELPVVTCPITPAYRDRNGKLRDGGTQFQKIFRLLNSDQPLTKINFINFCDEMNKFCVSHDITLAIKWKKTKYNTIDECCLSQQVIHNDERYRWPPWARSQSNSVDLRRKQSVQCEFLLDQSAPQQAEKPVQDLGDPAESLIQDILFGVN